MPGWFAATMQVPGLAPVSTLPETVQTDCVSDVKATVKRLDLPIAGQPATALVIGYDRRASEAKGAPQTNWALQTL